MSAIEQIMGHSAFVLSGMADTVSPDSLESEGAELLVRVRNAVIESVEYLMGSDGMSLPEAIEHMRDNGTDHEIADDAPSVYTHTLWLQFVDLAAYREDIEEYGEPSGDMNRNAALALYMIASRLVGVLLYELESESDD